MNSHEGKGQKSEIPRHERGRTRVDLKEELFNLRFQHATNQLENPLRIPETKRDIALIKTILREKELGGGA